MEKSQSKAETTPILPVGSMKLPTVFGIVLRHRAEPKHPDIGKRDSNQEPSNFLWVVQTGFVQEKASGFTVAKYVILKLDSCLVVLKSS